MTMNENGFRLNVTGDGREILDILRGMGEDAEQLRDEFLSSRMRLHDDDNDSPVSCSFVVDDLAVLGKLLCAFYAKGMGISLWACAENDEAKASIGFVRDEFDGLKQKVVVETLESRLKDKAGKLAEAAMEAKRILEEASR